MGQILAYSIRSLLEGTLEGPLQAPISEVQKEA
jgi:hypothetical protein